MGKKVLIGVIGFIVLLAVYIFGFSTGEKVANEKNEIIRSLNKKSLTEAKKKCFKILNPTPGMARNITKINECTGETWMQVRDPKTKEIWWSKVK